MKSGKILTDNSEIKKILKDANTIAVVGLSPKPQRDSNMAGRYLKEKGYKVIPVRPAQKEILGEKAYASLDDIEEPVDIITVFRNSARIMPHARRFVAVFCVRGMKTHRQAEGTVIVFLDEVLCQIPHHVGTFATTPIRLFQITGTRYRFIEVEHGLAVFHTHAKFAYETSSIPRTSKQHRIASQSIVFVHSGFAKRIPISAFMQAGKNGSPTGRTDRGGDKAVFKTNPMSRQSVNIGRLHNRMTGTPQRIIPLIIREEQNDIGSYVCFPPGQYRVRGTHT